MMWGRDLYHTRKSHRYSDPSHRNAEFLTRTPLTPEALKGKVVVVDFWTYSCINCLRSIPYVRAWAGDTGVDPQLGLRSRDYLSPIPSGAPGITTITTAALDVLGPTLANSHLHRIQHQFSAQAVCHRPSD